MIALAMLITYNYSVDLEDTLLALYDNNWKGNLGFFILFAGVYAGALFLLNPSNILKIIQNKKLCVYFSVFFLLLSFYQSCNIFVWYNGNYHSDYFMAKLQNRWDSLLVYALMMGVLGVGIGKSKYRLYGLFQWKFKKKIYLYLLMGMLPLLLWASTQPEFLAQYPNLKFDYFSKEEYLGKFLEYEPFYLLDFIGVEWVFRGFLILAFIQFFEEKTIVLAATVYCVFHFGKPMMECISSFFGGYILGYLSYRTQSIWGGIFVHMGIAFLMDIFAMISQIYF